MSVPNGKYTSTSLPEDILDKVTIDNIIHVDIFDGDNMVGIGHWP